MFTLGQTEGVAIMNGSNGFVSGEQISSVITIAPKLSRFDFSEYLFQGITNMSELHEGKLPLYPNPVYYQIFLSFVNGQFSDE